MNYFILKERNLPEDVNYQKGNYRVVEKRDEDGSKSYYRVDDFADKKKDVKINSNNLDSIHNYKGTILRGCLNSEVKILVYQDLFKIRQAYLVCTESPPLGLKVQQIEDLEDSINKFVISD